MKRSFGLKFYTIAVVAALLLLTLGSSRYQQAMRRARSATRSQDRFIIRQTINQYTLDHHHPPESVKDLIEGKYLLQIPNEITPEHDGSPVPGDPVPGPDPSARHF
jgi:hypothetical protein